VADVLSTRTTAILDGWYPDFSAESARSPCRIFPAPDGPALGALVLASPPRSRPRPERRNAGGGTTPQRGRDGHPGSRVLTPTLVRLEYAGDDRFTDARHSTCRPGTPVPAFTTDVAGGFREIHTAGLTCLQENRGRSPGRTLSYSSPAPPPPQPGVPSTASSTRHATRERLLGGSAATAYDQRELHRFRLPGGFNRQPVPPGQACPRSDRRSYQLQVRYATAQGGDGQSVTRTRRPSGRWAGPTADAARDGIVDTCRPRR